MSELRIGCAGWSYRDWVGPVYPARLPPAKWLESYAGMFPVVEIDATFYAIPTPLTVEGWIQRTRALPGFTFCAKVPQAATHEALPRGRKEEARRVLDEFVRIVVAPLEEAGRLEALLVQLPPSFGLDGTEEVHDAVTALAEFVEPLLPRRRRVAVEFRQQSWYEHVGERVAPEALEALAALPVAVAHVDGLGSRFHGSRTTKWSYFRLHGRRENIPPSERGLSHAPYNYLYSLKEIGEVAAPIAARAQEDERTLVVFNNHYQGQAVRNAMDLMAALGLARPKRQAGVARETKLDQF